MTPPEEQLREEFMTAPLVGLCERPMSEMSDEELRAKVVEIQRLRTSHQSFRAEVAKKSEEVLGEFLEQGEKKKKVLDEFL